MSKNALCPLLNKPCIEAKCKFWVHIVGAHPQSGAPMDHFDCSIAWLPVLLVEQSRRTVGVSAAVETMRNEVVQRQDELNLAVRIPRAPQTPRVEHDA